MKKMEKNFSIMKTKKYHRVQS